MKRQVSYASADDGAMLAYSVIGDGPITILLLSPYAQVEVVWEEPLFEHFLSRLAACATLVLVDRRGTGLSDRTTGSGEHLSLSRLATDIDGVIDAVGSDRVVLLASSLAAMIAVEFAATFPHRCDALVLIESFARLAQVRGFDFEHDPKQVDTWADGLARQWGSGVTVGANSSALTGDARYRAWAGRLERLTCSPGMAATTARWAAEYDVRPLLPKVLAPALVIHRRKDPVVPVGQGRYMAEHLPHSTYVELPGADHIFILGDQRALIDTIVRFLDGRFPNAHVRSRLRRAMRKDTFGSGWESLTPSEREIAGLVTAGMTNVEIGIRLRMSRHTVDGRLRRVFAKLGVSTRAELAAAYSRSAG